MIDEMDFKILESLAKRRGNRMYASQRAITNDIGTMPYHGFLTRLTRLEVCGLILGSGGTREWRIDDIGREVLTARELGLPYPSSNVE
jgi:hypothetical protein